MLDAARRAPAAGRPTAPAAARARWWTPSCGGDLHGVVTRLATLVRRGIRHGGEVAAARSAWGSGAGRLAAAAPGRQPGRRGQGTEPQAPAGVS